MTLENAQEIDFVVAGTAYEAKLTAGESDLRKLKKIAARVGIPQTKVISLNKIVHPSPDIIYPFGL